MGPDGRIAAIGDLNKDKGKTTINAEGLAVAPGFINMLSHAPDSLIVDSRGMSDIEQGVTLEVFGEYSQGPITAKYRAADEASQTDFKYKIEWTTLGEFMDYLVKRGTAPNIASFVGASTIRVYVLGLENRDPTPDELDAMREHVRHSKKNGAMGVTSALIYPPASYASTRELIELCKVASEYGGMYIVHMRSEGNKLLEAIDEIFGRVGERNRLGLLSRSKTRAAAKDVVAWRRSIALDLAALGRTLGDGASEYGERLEERRGGEGWRSRWSPDP